MHHNSSPPIIWITLIQRANEDRARYCTVWGSYNTNVHRKLKAIFLFLFRLLYHHVSSVPLPPSLDFLWARSLVLSQSSPKDNTISLSLFEKNLLSLRGGYGEMNHHRSSPSSRGWDGLRDWSKFFFGVGYLTYVGKRDDNNRRADKMLNIIISNQQSTHFLRQLVPQDFSRWKTICLLTDCSPIYPWQLY